MTDKEWAKARLEKTKANLERAQDDERYSDWYVTYLRTRVIFYSELLKC